MNDKAGTVDLDDDDIVDDGVIEISSDDDEFPATPVPLSSKAVKVKIEKADDGPVARRPVQGGRPIKNRFQSKNDANNLFKTLSTALDPSAQLARSNERSAQSLQMAQIISLSSQLRDAQNVIESLRNRLADIEHERSVAERRADRSEMLLLVNNVHTSTPITHGRYPLAPPPTPRKFRSTDDIDDDAWAGSDKAEYGDSSPSAKWRSFDVDANPITPPISSPLPSSSLPLPSSSPPS
jgi:hypothetical protein